MLRALARVRLSLRVVSASSARLLEDLNEGEASELYMQACELFDDAKDKDHYATQTFRSALSFLLSRQRFVRGSVVLRALPALRLTAAGGACRWKEAMKHMDAMVRMFNRLKQMHNIHQMIVTKVIITLYGGDPVEARRIFNSAVG
jgi:hypothetical protein